MEDENESVSKTLEYAYDDWCIMQMATTILRTTPETRIKTQHRGPKANASIFKDWKDIRGIRRVQNFRKSVRPGNGFHAAKAERRLYQAVCTERRHVQLYRGKRVAVFVFRAAGHYAADRTAGRARKNLSTKLDELFTTTDKLAGRDQPDITGLIGQYAHGNEPSHHIAYLYDYAERAVENAENRSQDNGRVLQTDPGRSDRQRRLRADVGVVCSERKRFLSGDARRAGLRHSARRFLKRSNTIWKMVRHL